MHYCPPTHDAACLPARFRSGSSMAATTTALLTSLDIQLPVAAANLLYACACASPAARTWLLDQSQSAAPAATQQQQQLPGGRAWAEGGMGGLRCVLPLLFHSLLTVRRAAARLLAAVLLRAEADKWEGWGMLVQQACTAGALVGGHGWLQLALPHVHGQVHTGLCICVCKSLCVHVCVCGLIQACMRAWPSLSAPSSAQTSVCTMHRMRMMCHWPCPQRCAPEPYLKAELCTGRELAARQNCSLPAVQREVLRCLRLDLWSKRADWISSP